jgi:hypothetical protein
MHNPPMPLPRLAYLATVAAVVALFVTGCGSATDGRPPQWSFISATITEPSCATVNCHSASTQRAGLDLSARDVGYNRLIGGLYVVPGNADQSSLMVWLTAGGSLRMPPDNPLSDADIQLIETWINDGAHNN